MLLSISAEPEEGLYISSVLSRGDCIYIDFDYLYFVFDVCARLTGSPAGCDFN